jgi:predicted nucleic acid-binding protein
MSGAERHFIDTNVWLYAFVTGNEPAKSVAAANLLQRTGNIAVSVQVINEVCVNLVQKARFAELEIRALIQSFFVKCLVVPLDERVLIDASRLREIHSLSFWDSMIVSSALACHASTLYTEDLQHDILIDGVLRVRNPFLS